MGGKVLKVSPHSVVSTSVCSDTAVALTAAHKVFRSEVERFNDADFLPLIAAINLACHRFDHCPSTQ